MDISQAIETEYVEHTPETPVSKLVGTFEDPDIHGVVVHGDEFEGVVTRRQLATTHQKPQEKLGSLVWHVPRIRSADNIRDVAGLMLESSSHLLPVFEGDEMTGVVTANSILNTVVEHLDAATVADGYTEEIHTVEPDTTLAQALNLMREESVRHVPVIEDRNAVGIISIYDMVDITIRTMRQQQGGDPGGTDSTGQSIASRAANTRRGGYGERDGELERVLDLPVRDVMSSPAHSATPDETLETAVGRMFDNDVSSLIVRKHDNIVGIVTKTDALDSLTWEAGGNRAVQLYGASMLDDTSYEDVVAMIDTFDNRDGKMTVLDAKIHLQEHEEQHRGTPLLLARIRLDTDRGLYMASGEGYGASHALNEARDKLERRIRDKKTHGDSKKPPGEEFWEKRFGWLLEEA